MATQDRVTESVYQGLKFSMRKINMTTESIKTFTNKNRDTLFANHRKAKRNKDMRKSQEI